jgi:hypothetical protein
MRVCDSQEAEQGVLLNRQLSDQSSEGVHSVSPVAQVDDLNELGVKLASEEVDGKLAQVLLEQASDGMRVVILVASEEVDVTLGVEALLE